MPIFKNIKTVSIPSIGKLPIADKPGTFVPMGKKREHKAGRQAEDGGFVETATPARLDLNLNLVNGIDIDMLNAVSNETITIRMSDGSVYMMPQSYSTEPIGVQDDPKITFMSNTSERLS